MFPFPNNNNIARLRWDALCLGKCATLATRQYKAVTDNFANPYLFDTKFVQCLLVIKNRSNGINPSLVTQSDSAQAAKGDP